MKLCHDGKELVVRDECWTEEMFMVQVKRWLKISAHPDQLYLRFKEEKLDALVIGPSREVNGLTYRPAQLLVTGNSS